MKNKKILQKANGNETISVSVRISAILHNRLRNIQDAARQNGMKFPLSSVINTALTNAIDSAESEIILLNKMTDNKNEDSQLSQGKSIL